MFYLPPRPFLLGQFNFPVTSAREWFTRSIPVGANWRFQYLLINYPVGVEEGAQTTVEPLYKLYDADGRAFHVNPVLAKQVTSPAGFPNLRGTNPINIDYPGGSSVKLEIEFPTGTLPATISITLFGIRGWEGFGR